MSGVGYNGTCRLLSFIYTLQLIWDVFSETANFDLNQFSVLSKWMMRKDFWVTIDSILSVTVKFPFVNINCYLFFNHSMKDLESGQMEFYEVVTFWEFNDKYVKDAYRLSSRNKRNEKCMEIKFLEINNVFV